MTRPQPKLSLGTLRKANEDRLYAIHPGYWDVTHPNYWVFDDWLTAVVGEAGKACNLLKKLRRGDDVSPAELGAELADTVCYLDMLALTRGVELSGSDFPPQRVAAHPIRHAGAWIRALLRALGTLANQSLLVSQTAGLAQDIHAVIDILGRIADCAGIDLAEATALKFNEISDRRGVDIKLVREGDYYFVYRPHYTISGSHGSVVADRDGKVVDRTGAIGTEYVDIDRFDVVEYRKHYGTMTDTDILLIGYWIEDGRYEPPDEDARKVAAESAGAIVLP